MNELLHRTIIGLGALVAIVVLAFTGTLPGEAAAGLIGLLVPSPLGAHLASTKARKDTYR